MKNKTKNSQLNAQDVQDNIFKRMSADQKLKLGSDLWILGRELIGNKIYKNYEENYDRNRSQTSSY